MRGDLALGEDDADRGGDHLRARVAGAPGRSPPSLVSSAPRDGRSRVVRMIRYYPARDAFRRAAGGGGDHCLGIPALRLRHLLVGLRAGGLVRAVELLP